MRNPAEAHCEFRTRRRCFLSLGLTKLHTRPTPLSIMPTTPGTTTHAGGVKRESELCVCWWTWRGVSPPRAALLSPCLRNSQGTRIWNTSGARTARFNPLILQIDNERYQTAAKPARFARPISPPPAAFGSFVLVPSVGLIKVRRVPSCPDSPRESCTTGFHIILCYFRPGGLPERFILSLRSREMSWSVVRSSLPSRDRQLLVRSADG